MVEPWTKERSTVLGDYRIFRLREDESRSPRTGRLHTFYVLEATDWVNVIPLTIAGNVVMVHQYRHGTEDVTLELPAGMVDPGDSDPAQAAARELAEETGYEAAAFTLLGSVAPNPAFLDNRCHTYLAAPARATSAPNPQGAEELALEEVPLTSIPDLIRNGRITHSLTISAFHYLALYQQARSSR